MRFVSALLSLAFVGQAAVYLEPNRGQAKVDSPLIARTALGAFGAGPTAIQYLRSNGSSANIVFESASSGAVSHREPLPGVSHYVLGSDPTQWLWDVPHYASVRYEGIYSGIDLIYHASGNNVEFDFLVRPGADPSQIRMRVPSNVRVDASGSLRMDGVWLHPPVAWQNLRGERVTIPVHFVVDRRHRIFFELGNYDHKVALTIDPVIQFASFLGGSGNDTGVRILSGPDGAVYLAGNTLSPDFPASLPSGDPLNRPETLLSPLAFVSRFESDASRLDWSLFIGGTAIQFAFALKLDSFGNLYLLGGTTSANFPVTPGAWRTTIDPSSTDLFLVKFNAQTGHMVTSTFLGIELYENTLNQGGMLAIDPAGGVYVGAARLYSGNFTPTPGVLDSATPQLAFVMRFNSSITAAVYATYWPFGSVDAMDVDVDGKLVVGGVASGCAQCGTPAFPAVHPLPGVNQNPVFPAQAYVARLNANGTGVDFATLLHGDGEGSLIGDLKILPDGTIYVYGADSGTNFPIVHPLNLDALGSTTPPAPGSGGSPFLARFASDGSSLLQSTSINDATVGALRLAFQSNGQPCLAGLNFQPSQQAVGGLLGTNPGSYAPAGWSLSCVDQSGTSLRPETDLPPTGGYYADIATTKDGAFLFTGNADSTLVTTSGVVQTKFGGSGPYSFDYYNLNLVPLGDAFLMRVSLDNPAPEIQQVSPDFVVLDNADSAACTPALTGAGFGYGATATLNGQTIASSFVDSGHASLSFPCSALQPGANHVVMTLPPPGGGRSEGTITGLNAPPSTISVSPASVTQGAGETKVVIRAMNLSAASSLFWNGSLRKASFVLDGAGSNSGHFELLLEPAELAQPSNVQVTVSNPGPGGGVSAPALFTVQPSFGPGVPTLIPPDPLAIGGLLPFGPDIQFGGSGFTANTTVFWDGQQISVTSFTSTGITVQPPAADLTRLGVHQVYAKNGSFQSLAVPVYVTRALENGTAAYAPAAYDPVQQRFYFLATQTTPPSTYTHTLFSFDATTGNLVNSITGSGQGEALAVSANGQYVYFALGTTGSQSEILRYNTGTKTVDLQWTIALPEGQTQSGINSLAPPPDSPETVIVSTVAGDILIYDGDQPRRYDSAAAGFSTVVGNSEGYGVFFASSKRIYAVSGPVYSGIISCWIWLDYDAFGISGGQPPCGAPPPEIQLDSGVSYLTDGVRTYAISLPMEPPLPNTPYYSPSLALDLRNREAWEFLSSSYNGNQLFSYRMDAQQLQLQIQIGQYFYPGGGTIYPVGNGSVLLLIPGELFLIPATPAQPNSH